ncbi:MAG: aminoglycoside phosphotransferase family protein [Patescibacteria group bacterium]|jgi:thiamine kinase-like enzyme
MNRKTLLIHVRNILKKRGLTPDEDVKDILKHHMRFFRTRCVDQEGNKFTFKIYLLKLARTRRDFQNEIAFYRYAAKAHLDQFPRWVAGNRNSQNPWIIYHFIPGELFTNYLRKHQHSLSKNLIQKLTHALLAYGNLKLPHNVKKQLHLKPAANNYSDRFRGYLQGNQKNTLLKYLSNAELEAAARIIAFHQLGMKLKSQTAVSHGDLSTNNLLIHQQDFAVLDWEHVQFASPAYDAAEIWVKEFSKAPWRNHLALRLTKSQANSEAFSWLFCIEVLLFCLRDLLLHDRILHELHSPKRKRIVRKLLNYYVKTFRASLRGFSPLLKS